MKKTTDDKNDKEKTNEYIQNFLPQAINRIIGSYEDFVTTEKTSACLTKDIEDIKNFIEFHKACKIALSNIEFLLKFYKWVEMTDVESKTDSHNFDKICDEIKAAEDRLSKDLGKNPSE